MRRIIIFSVAYYPHISGAEIAIKEITDRLKEGEFDLVTVRFSRQESKFEKIGKVNVYRVGFTPAAKYDSRAGMFFLRLNKNLFPVLGALKASLLHLRRRYTFGWAMMANYSGFAALFFHYLHPRVPYILTLQEGDPPEYIKRRARFVYPLFKEIFRRAAIIQSISNFLSNFARDMGYVGKIEVIPNAVDCRHFSQAFSHENVAATKRELGFKDDDLVLMTVSRLVVKNGVADIIKALEFLPDKCKLAIIGTGELRPKLEELAASKGLTSRVIFTGFKANEEVPRYLSAAFVFVRPSLSEGLGNSFIEAMAAGVPVIAASVGGIPDFITHNETGLFCEIGNPKSIAEQVMTLIEKSDLRQKLIQNARDMVLAKYDWSLIAREMEKKVFASY